MFIVSAVEIVSDGSGEFKSDSFEGVTYGVERASGDKCERCWVYSETVGTDSEHPTLCSRCANEIITNH
ncbi:MAG: hypothetical protein K2G04_03095 [Oscillospiraceae bacterium]|nr:hypothetical protein [Oscillospiraceae bacterium]